MILLKDIFGNYVKNGSQGIDYRESRKINVVIKVMNISKIPSNKTSCPLLINITKFLRKQSARGFTWGPSKNPFQFSVVKVEWQLLCIIKISYYSAVQDDNNVIRLYLWWTPPTT